MAVHLESATLTELATLEGKINALLSSRLGGQVRDVRLMLRDDVLVIKGKSQSYYGKQIAQQILMETAPEHQSLINEIDIC